MTDRAVGPDRPGEPLGIVAGGGLLPHLVAAGAKEAGWTPFVIAIADGVRADYGCWEHVNLAWSKTGDVFRILKARAIRRIVFCGTISVRPDYRSFVPSWRTLAMLPEILAMVRGGDDSLLRGVSAAFARRGVEVIGVQAILPRLLTPAGALTSRQPSERERLALHRAAQSARALGLMDIGQAVIASPDRVIALEGIEGTEETLKRVAALRRDNRIGRGEPCVLFKAFKPQQDERFDLPSIGVETVQQAKAAGLKGIGMTAQRSLLIGSVDILAAAEEAGLFLVGLPEGDSLPGAAA